MSKFEICQLAVGGLDDNYAYLIRADNGDTAVVDPSGRVELITAALDKLRPLTPVAILLTHGHHDHTSGVKALQREFAAPVCAHPDCTFRPERPLADHERIPFGDGFIECLYSPGHSNDSVIYRLSDDSAVFTGDTLFIDCCGYCIAATMYQTMREVIFPLADSNVVYSGHNYGREPSALLGVEKRRNPFLAAALKPLPEFQEQLKQL